MFASQRVKPIIACQSLAGLLHALHFHGQEQLSGIQVAQFLECVLNKNYSFYKQGKHRNASFITSIRRRRTKKLLFHAKHFYTKRDHLIIMLLIVINLWKYSLLCMLIIFICL